MKIIEVNIFNFETEKMIRKTNLIRTKTNKENTFLSDKKAKEYSKIYGEEGYECKPTSYNSDNSHCVVHFYTKYRSLDINIKSIQKHLIELKDIASDNFEEESGSEVMFYETQEKIYRMIYRMKNI